ncbi:MAG: adenylate cyclase, partial [Chloroflexota bacterium]
FVKLTPELWQKMLSRAERGVALAPNDFQAHAILSTGYAFSGRYADALRHGAEALRINPHVPFTHFVKGVALWVNGEHAEAVTELEVAWNLGYNDPERYHFAAILSFAHYHLRQYDAALSWAEYCLKIWPEHLQAIGCRAATLAQLGRMDEAHAALETFKSRLPGATASSHLRNFKWRRPEDIELYREGLVKAGLPAS